MDGNSPEISIRPTTAALQHYFDGLMTRFNTSNTGIPIFWQWERNKVFVSEAEKLRSGSNTGYITGADTAKTREGYKDRIITGAQFDDYCRLFGYGEYGQGIIGKKILDVGSGISIFGAVGNYVYGDTGTSIVSLDPAYAEESVVSVLKTKESIVPNSKDEVVPRNRASHLVAGIAQELPFPDNTFDEVISQWAIVLVPPEELPHSIEEMYRVARDKIKLTPFISFVDVESLTLPKGVTLTQQSLDGFTLEINKKEAAIEEVLAWLQSNTEDDERKFQLQSSEDLDERRKKGYYYNQMTGFFEKLDEMRKRALGK